MTKNSEVEEIKHLIEGFKVPSQDTFVECMLVAYTQDSAYYKGGIFICDEGSSELYMNKINFWVRSFYSFIENARNWRMFQEVVPLIQWKNISPADFSEQYYKLIKDYKPDHFFLETQSYEESKIAIEDRVFSETVNVLDGSIVSSVAKADGGYISFFIIADEIGLQYKWPKA